METLIWCARVTGLCLCYLDNVISTKMSCAVCIHEDYFSLMETNSADPGEMPHDAALLPNKKNKFVSGLFKAFECFSSTFQGKFYFQGLFKTVLYIQILFKPVRTLKKT